MFTNPTILWTDMNPEFFQGTVVEEEVKKLLAEKEKQGAKGDLAAPFCWQRCPFEVTGSKGEIPFKLPYIGNGSRCRSA